MKKLIALVLALSLLISSFSLSFAASLSFDDVNGTKYAGAVQALVELGVVEGLPDRYL